MQILEKYKVYPGLLSGFWLDIFAQLAQTACKPMNSIDFCLFAYRDVGKGREQGCGSFEQAEQKSLNQNSGFGCNILASASINYYRIQSSCG